MKCPICEEDNDEVSHCICGYCKVCIDKYGHEGCKQMKEKKKNER
jgi:hypothetical protein